MSLISTINIPQLGVCKFTCDLLYTFVIGVLYAVLCYMDRVITRPYSALCEGSLESADHDDVITCHRWIPAQRPVPQSFGVFFDLLLVGLIIVRLVMIWDAIVLIMTSL